MTSEAERFFRESEYWRAWSSMPDLTAEIPYALAALGPEHRRVLDAPCGSGRLLKAVRGAQPATELYGLDINQRMIEQVRRALPDVPVCVASVVEMPFASRCFDAVLCHESFMHFDRPQAALAELARVARRTLYLSVTTTRQLNTALRALRGAPLSDVPHWTYDYKDVRRLLPSEFDWRIQGAFLVGRKALRLSHAAHLRVHRLVGRRLPQWLLRRFGQTLFAYGTRRAGT